MKMISPKEQQDIQHIINWWDSSGSQNKFSQILKDRNIMKLDGNGWTTYGKYLARIINDLKLYKKDEA